MVRRKWTPDEKVQIVLSGLRNEEGIGELCRRYAIPTSLYYRWRDKFIEGGKLNLQNIPVNGEAALRKENEELRQTVADLALEVRLLKKLRGLA